MQPLTETEKQERLPFPKWWPIVAGALFGLALRLTYSGAPNEIYDAMMGSFILIAPLAVGAITVYLAERLARRGWGYYLFAGMAANALFILGTLVSMIEGAICAIIILPLCQRTIERSVTIEAPRAVVWEQLMNVRDIRREEVDDGIAFRIGVPPPLSALSGDVSGQRVRRISMGKHVHFDQIEAERRELDYIRWTQRFYPDSFPPGSFDQHVVMGGEHFDIDSVAYSLAAEGPATRLTVTMHYRVSTRFNWYADAVARIVLGNLEEVLLGVYQERSQAG